jgi:hypothetical protein
MEYKQIMPAIDWYFKFENTVWNIAAFALTADDKVIGLVGAGNDGYLTTVPTQTKGVYLQRRQLSEEELAAADKKR